MIRHIPNILTLCNLACGCYGIVMVFRGDILMGSFMIWAGALFDFLDGFAARMLKKFSSIGKDLDSLADLITFCFLPATIVFASIEFTTPGSYLAFAGYLLVIFGAVRLARFNNDPRQSEHFYGLPVPASGLFVSALPFISAEGQDSIFSFATEPYALVTIAVLLSVMMVSDIKLMSLKFSNFSFGENWQRYLLVLLALLLLVFLQIVAIPIIILLYVVWSIALNIAE